MRPAYLPSWASGVSGVAGITEPTQNQKNTGWQANQAPPHGYLNWLHKGAYDWLNYLSYETVVEDHFVRDQQRYGIATGALSPIWETSPYDALAADLSVFLQAEISGQTGVPASYGHGIVNLVGAASGAGSFIRAEVDAVTQQPNTMIEVTVRVPSRGGGRAMIGAFSSVGTPGEGFGYTGGATGNWYYALSSSQLIDLGVAPSSTLYQRLCAERNGSVVHVSIDDTEVAVATRISGPPSVSQFGAWAASGNEQLEIDRIRLAIRR